MRFLHTADWQIGMRAAHAGEAAARVRAARLDTARRVCDLAAGLDFMLLAGDTFEDNGVARDLVVETAQILSTAQCPVFVLPGNHDPLQPGSVWEHSVWSTVANVTILRDCRPVEIPGAVLSPCPLFTRRSPHDPTAWIPNDRGTSIRIGVAHGNVGDKIAEDGGFPIAFDTATRANLDYLALGHWHSMVKFPPAGPVRMAYSGTPEPTCFGEPNSGNVLIVSIAQPGADPDVQIRQTASLRWVRVGPDERVTSPGKLAEIARHLCAIPDTDRTLIEVALSGLLFECDQDELPRIQKACSRFLHARLDTAALRPAPEDADWVLKLPGGAVREAADRLRRLAVSGDEEAEIATQALLELYAAAQEVRL